MWRSRFLALVVAAVFSVAVPGYGGVITFTGNAATDFLGSAYFADPGGVGDVGMPGQFPSSAVSGWDLAGIYGDYDAGSDTLFVGVKMAPGVIAGDADGDGSPDSASALLQSLSGDDLADFGGTESFVLSIDLDGDGTCDIVAGVGSGMTTADYKVAAQIPGAFAPFAFGADATSASGSVLHLPIDASRPDLEFTIANFSQLPGAVVGPGGPVFAFDFFMGSLQDDGIGEDFMGRIEVPEPATLTAAALAAAAAFVRRRRRHTHR